MSKLIPVILILAFLFTWLRPLASSAAPGVMICPMSVHECTHGESCPMHRKKAVVPSAHEAHSAHDGAGTHADNKISHDSEKHLCGTFYRCDTGSTPENASWNTMDLAFVKSSPFDLNESIDDLTFAMPVRDVIAATARIDKPPRPSSFLK
ncbi:MAG: hypothetical protein HY956_06400 [Deltaproteobacteria bacterium]|nr:hypothetical protein [Deltaproteobacteria bacterium]